LVGSGLAAIGIYHLINIVMSIKVALLKSGESVIADIKELISNDNICGYLFENPNIITYLEPEVLTEQTETSKLKISLIPWILITSDTKIPVRSDWVITIVEPIEEVKKIYEEKINGEDSQVNSVGEQQNLVE
tara:strand:- start:684 stop:1082 length:399 start_codon:yes stop_codon:yes gene_type:complete